VRAVLVEGAYFEASVRSSVLTTLFPFRGLELDAAPGLGAHDVATVMTRDLGDDLTVSVPLSESFWTRTGGFDSCCLSIRIGNFDEIWETVVAVSIGESEVDFLWKSVLRALDSSLSVRELREFRSTLPSPTLPCRIQVESMESMWIPHGFQVKCPKKEIFTLEYKDSMWIPGSFQAHSM
jgi:hypothetical protein